MIDPKSGIEDRGTEASVAHPPFAVSFQLTPDELREFGWWQVRHHRKTRNVVLGWSVAVVVVLGGVLYLFCYFHGQLPRFPWYFLALAAMGLPAFAWLYGLAAAEAAMNSPGMQLPRTIEFDAHGCRTVTQRGETRIEWSGISAIDPTPHLLLIWLYTPSAVIVPRRALGTAEAAEESIRKVQRLWDAARAAPTPTDDDLSLTDHPEALRVTFAYWRGDLPAIRGIRYTADPKSAAVAFAYAAIAFAVDFVNGWGNHQPPYATMVLCVVASVGLFRPARRLGPGAPQSSVNVVAIWPAGLAFDTSGFGRAEVQWKALRSVTRRGAYLCFCWRRGAIVLIPRRAFPSAEAADGFYAAARRWHASAVAAGGPTDED